MRGVPHLERQAVPVSVRFGSLRGSQVCMCCGGLHAPPVGRPEYVRRATEHPTASRNQYDPNQDPRWQTSPVSLVLHLGPRKHMGIEVGGGDVPVHPP